MVRIYDSLDDGGYQPTISTAAPDLAVNPVSAVNLASNSTQDSYEVVIENIDLNLYKFLALYILF